MKRISLRRSHHHHRHPAVFLFRKTRFADDGARPMEGKGACFTPFFFFPRNQNNHLPAGQKQRIYGCRVFLFQILILRSMQRRSSWEAFPLTPPSFCCERDSERVQLFPWHSRRHGERCAFLNDPLPFFSRTQVLERIRFFSSQGHPLWDSSFPAHLNFPFREPEYDGGLCLSFFSGVDGDSFPGKLAATEPRVSSPLLRPGHENRQQSFFPSTLRHRPFHKPVHGEGLLPHPLLTCWSRSEKGGRSTLFPCRLCHQLLVSKGGPSPGPPLSLLDQCL